MAHTYAWDASDYDWDRGPMDLAAARRDGVQAFWHKATEGSTWRSRRAAEALNRARAAGFPLIGAYHVVRSSSTASAQITNLLSYADANFGWWRDFGGWFWVVDVEKWNNDNVSASTGMAVARELRARQPKPVVIYASKGQYGTSFVDCGFPLWNANYGSNPSAWYASAVPADDSSRWAGWEMALQYGSKLTVGGQGTCDVSVHKGDLASLQAAIGTIIGGVIMGVDLDWHGWRTANLDKNLGGRPDAVQLADLWAGEQLERGPYDDPDNPGPGSPRTQRIRRIDEGVQELLLRPAGGAQFNEEQLAKLAAALAPLLVKPVVEAVRQQLAGVTFRSDLPHG